MTYFISDSEHWRRQGNDSSVFLNPRLFLGCLSAIDWMLPATGCIYTMYRRSSRITLYTLSAPLVITTAFCRLEQHIARNFHSPIIPFDSSVTTGPRWILLFLARKIVGSAYVVSRYNPPMGSETAELLKRALALPVEERAELANTLLESLDGSTDPAVAAAWEAEILRRMEDVESGNVVPLTLEEARRKLFSPLE